MPIYIMTHKHSELPQSDFYEGVGLGGFNCSTIQHVDNSNVDNISHLNKYYCELTGIYHIWRHIQSELIGICHYRRYFNLVPLNFNSVGLFSSNMNADLKMLLENQEQISTAKDLLRTYDVLLPKAVHSNNTIGEDYVASHGDLEWKIFLQVLDEYYGADRHGIRTERRNFFWNMMITRRSFFDHYCAHLFAVINRVYQRIGQLSHIEGTRYQPYRYPGYLAERFMAAFINVHGVRFYESSVIITD